MRQCASGSDCARPVGEKHLPLPDKDFLRPKRSGEHMRDYYKTCPACRTARRMGQQKRRYRAGDNSVAPPPLALHHPTGEGLEQPERYLRWWQGLMREVKETSRGAKRI